ncbi:MAG: hypothetical protein ABJF10_05455 [Chthoniobacter sp.]|uniref:hypothetical protein n=1 Tax=Chthoniobacter sp. TaxID=2510640 RepID=UPI0032AA33BB
MNKAASHLTSSQRNIAGQSPPPPPPPPCAHQYEAVTRYEGVVFKHCTKCGRQEAK